MFVSGSLNSAKGPYKQLETFESNILRYTSHSGAASIPKETVPRNSAPLGNYPGASANVLQ